jgi:hypothetical protein
LNYSFGLEWKKNLGELQDGIGTGTDWLAPVVGMSWLLNQTNSLTFTLKYAYSYFEDDDAPPVRSTIPRILWISQMPRYQAWFKVEDELAFDHENDETLNTVALQVGKMFSAGFGVYLDALFQTGGDKVYDWGAGIGARMVF